MIKLIVDKVLLTNELTNERMDNAISRVAFATENRQWRVCCIFGIISGKKTTVFNSQSVMYWCHSSFIVLSFSEGKEWEPELLMIRTLGKSSIKKKTEKSDIVHIWVLTHPTLPISDIQFSDIFF